MSNPLLSEDKFARTGPPTAWPDAEQPGWGAPPGQPIPPSGDPVSAWPPPPPADERTLTRGGVARATLLLFVLMCITAVLGWNAVVTETSLELVDGVQTEVSSVVSVPFWVFIGPLVGLVAVLATFFKPAIARFTAPIYALAQGIFIGAISKVFETQWDGIVVQAITLTFGVFAIMLALYASGRIRVTPRFQLIVIAATLGIAVVYLVSFVVSLFGASVPYIHGSGPIGIAFSVFVVGIAAMNLALDFDFIDRAEAARAERSMEWFAALGLMVTLIWLYLEILRLLAKLRER